MTSSPDNTVEILEAFKNYVVESVTLRPSDVKHRKINATQAKQFLDSHYLSIFLELVGEDEDAEKTTVHNRGTKNATRTTYQDDVIVTQNALRAELRTALQDRLGEK